jgi:membrane fusion protein (multidrug efflux system)
MRMGKGAKIIAVVSVFAGVVAASGCGKQDAAKMGAQGAPTEVSVVTVQPQRVIITTELVGRTSANRLAEIRPQVGGIVLKRLFTEGSEVKAGQALFQIDPATYQAALDNAKAALGKSEANLSAIKLKAERIKELLVDKAVSQQDYDDASAALKQNEADIQYWKATVETARINLKYTNVIAPISGRIGRSSVTEGALVTAMQPTPLAMIHQLDPMYVDVPQSTTEVLRLQRRLADGRLKKNGTMRNKVAIYLEDGHRYAQDGELQFRDIAVDQTTGSVNLRVIVPNPKRILLPGMFVRAVVEEGVSDNAIMVPQQAVSRDTRGNPLCMTVDGENKVAIRMLTIERAIGNKWLVTAGLASGDKVIVEGLQKVRPGVPVKAVPFVEQAPDKGAPGQKAAPPAAAAATSAAPPQSPAKAATTPSAPLKPPAKAPPLSPPPAATTPPAKAN